MKLNYFFYALMIFGLILAFTSSITQLFRHGALKIEVARQQRNFTKGERKKTMTQLLNQTFISLNSSPSSIKLKTTMFYVWTVLLGFGGFVFFASKVSLSFGFIIGVVGAVTPAALLYTRLQKMRIDSSYEGDILINEFTNQYKIRSRNIIEALEKTAANIPEAPLTSVGVLRLCHKLREVREEEDIDDALDEFVFQIDTEWSRKFALSISSGLKYQVVLDESLADLADELAKARKIIEKGKRENNESAVIIKYITIPLYLGTMIFGSSYMGSSPIQAFRNQFGTPTGLKYFAFMLIVYMFSILLLIMYDNQKMDLE